MQKPCRAREPGEFGAGRGRSHQREAPGFPSCPTVVRRDPASIAMGRPARTLFRLACGTTLDLFLGRGSVYKGNAGTPGHAQTRNQHAE
jgi:hypothetical protein